MRGLNIVLWPELKGNTIFPVLELSVQFTNRVEKFAIRLFRGLDRVQPLVDLALNDRECTHEAEQVHSTLSVRKWNVANVVRWKFAGQVHVHVVIILDWWSSGSQTDVFVKHVSDPEHALPLLDF